MTNEPPLLSKIQSTAEQLGLSQEHLSSLKTPRTLSEIVEVHDHVLNSSEAVWGPSDLLDLSSREFELLIGLLYANDGYETAITPKSHDGGVDIIAKKGSKGILIEAKRLSSGRVSVGDIRDVYSVAKDINSLDYAFCEVIAQITDVVVFTTSGLSGDAQRRMDRIKDNEEFRAWTANSETTCNLLNLSGVNKSEWKQLADSSVIAL